MEVRYALLIKRRVKFIGKISVIKWPKQSLLKHDPDRLLRLLATDQVDPSFFYKVIEVGGELEFGDHDSDTAIEALSWDDVMRWDINSEGHSIFDSIGRHSKLDVADAGFNYDAPTREVDDLGLLRNEQVESRAIHFRHHRSKGFPH